MRLYTILFDDRETVAVGYADHNLLYPLSAFGLSFPCMQALVEGASDADWAKLRQIPVRDGLLISEATLLAPIPEPRQDAICLGINYTEHAVESARFHQTAFGGERPVPVFFSKRIARANVPYGEIPSYPGLVDSLDYECELAAIIGKTASRVSTEDALDYVLGYTIFNDFSARNIQTAHKQWYFGKSLDGFAPMGPCIVTADEFDAPPALAVRSYVNGELRQNGNTNQLIHGVAQIIHILSQGITLLPGTIIATGTPAGVGMGFVPPKFLAPGDEVISEIEGIGRMRHIVK